MKKKKLISLIVLLLHEDNLSQFRVETFDNQPAGEYYISTDKTYRTLNCCLQH